MGLFPLVSSCLWALGVPLGLFPLAFSCFGALGVLLGLFPHAFSCLGALGVRLGLFPHVYLMSVHPRGSFGFVSSCCCMSLGLGRSFGYFFVFPYLWALGVRLGLFPPDVMCCLALRVSFFLPFRNMLCYVPAHAPGAHFRRVFTSEMTRELFGGIRPGGLSEAILGQVSNEFTVLLAPGLFEP